MNNELIIEGYKNRFNKNIDSLQSGGEISYLKTYNKNYTSDYKLPEDEEITPYQKTSLRITNPQTTSTPTVVAQTTTQATSTQQETNPTDTPEIWNDIDDIVLFEEEVPDEYKDRYTNGRWESYGGYTLFIPNDRQYEPEVIINTFQDLANGRIWPGKRGSFSSGRFKILDSVNVPIEQQRLSLNVEHPGTKSKRYSESEKQVFVNDMLNAYRTYLTSIGKDPKYAEYFVAQDALETGYGQHYAGNWNFGNITKGSWKGSTTSGKDHDGNGNVIRQQFRNYNSLEEYIQDKLSILGNNRYDIWSYSPEQLYDRLVVGGYAEDKKYKEKLNNIYNYLFRTSSGKQGLKLPSKDIVTKILQNRNVI